MDREQKRQLILRISPESEQKDRYAIAAALKGSRMPVIPLYEGAQIQLFLRSGPVRSQK